MDETKSDLPRQGERVVPNGARLARCRTCHAPIYWTTTDKKKPVPLSAATVRVNAAGVRFALPHFVDCPDAAQHRKPARPEKTETRPILNAVRELQAEGRRGAIEWADGQALPVLRPVADDVFVFERAQQDDLLRRIQKR